MSQSNTPQRSPIASWRLLYRVPLLILWLLFSVITIRIAQLIGYPKWLSMAMRCHRGSSRIFGFNINISGQLSDHMPTLFVSNHISYLDILAMGGYIPGYFIAKSEVASWPVFGFLSKVQNTLFIERRGKHAKSQVKTMQDHLRHGGNLILYPEGTSTDGFHVEPFKSSLFQAAELDTPEPIVMIQPITIAYTHYRQQPMDQQQRDHYAWYGDMPFASHFIRALSSAEVRIELMFHPPVKVTDFESRKACAQHCQQQVTTGLTQALPEGTR